MKDIIKKLGLIGLTGIALAGGVSYIIIPSCQVISKGLEVCQKERQQESYKLEARDDILRELFISYSHTTSSGSFRIEPYGLVDTNRNGVIEPGEEARFWRMAGELEGSYFESAFFTGKYAKTRSLLLDEVSLQKLEEIRNNYLREIQEKD